MSGNVNRAAQIAQDLYNVIAPQNMAHDAAEKAKAASRVAGDTLATTRTEILASVAALSHTGAWSEAEITEAAAKIPALYNDQDDKKAVSALKTFASECRRVAHPSVRARFDDVAKMVSDAWDTEAEIRALDSDAPSPLKDCFARKYHAIITTCRVIADGVVRIDDDEDLIDYAKANDPALMPDKVAKRLEDLLGKLSEIAVDFPMQRLSDAMRAIGEIDEAALKQARAAKVAGVTTVVTQPNEPSAPAHPFTPKAARAPAKPKVVPVTVLADKALNDERVTTDEALDGLVPEMQDAAN